MSIVARGYAGAAGSGSRWDAAARRLITLLQRVEQLGAQQFRQPGQGELVNPEPGPVAGDPDRQFVIGKRGDRALAAQPLVMETAQTAPDDTLQVAACDPALGGPGQRAGPGDERRDRFASVLVPAAFMPEAQGGPMHIALATRHPAAVAPQRPGGPRRRRGVELRPGHARTYPGGGSHYSAPMGGASRSGTPGCGMGSSGIRCERGPGAGAAAHTCGAPGDR
jgi:hypothetical protein